MELFPASFQYDLVCLLAKAVLKKIAYVEMGDSRLCIHRDNGEWNSSFFCNQPAYTDIGSSYQE